MKNIYTQLARRNKGMTLLELTVVILVLLSLISVLFIGARAWKNGSDRANCILNIRNVQTGGRSLQNMYGFDAGDAFDDSKVPGTNASLKDAIVGSNKFVETDPTCPKNGTYTYATAFPAVGAAILSCDLSTTDQHVPSSLSGW